MHDGGLDLGRWPEGAGRYAERQSDVAIELGEDREAAVRLAALVLVSRGAQETRALTSDIKIGFDTL